MTEEPRHETVLAAAMLGVVRSAGWMTMPIEVDLGVAYARLQGDGGVQVGRERAVVYARQLMDRVSEVRGVERPEMGEDEERLVAGWLGVAYDQIAAGVRP